MALIERYYVIAASYDVDPSSLTIKEGMLVRLNSTAGVRRVTTGDDGNVLGVAGDSNSTSACYMPGIGTGYMSQGTVAFQNRVSDGFNETRASGKITVYYGGGEFYTDQFTQDGNLTNANVGRYLKADETTGRFIYDAADKTANSVAVLLSAPAAIESGVPGTDVNGSTSVGGENTNTYILFKLII